MSQIQVAPHIVRETTCETTPDVTKNDSSLSATKLELAPSVALTLRHERNLVLLKPWDERDGDHRP